MHSKGLQFSDHSGLPIGFGQRISGFLDPKLEISESRLS